MRHDLRQVPIAPLGIAVDGPGRYRIVNTVAGMADLLVNHWPIGEKREAWRAALGACLKSLEGTTSGEEAREVFILAAQDATMPLILEPSSPSGQHHGQPSIAVH